MKKILILFICSIITLSAMAQKKTVAEKAKEKTEEMQKDLQLTPDQNKKIYEVNVKTYTSIADYESKNPSKKLKKKQKNIAQDWRDEQYKKILTPSQYKKMKDLKKKEKEEEKRLDKLKSEKDIK